MSQKRRDVWITGIGIISSLGEGMEPHRAALNDTSGRGPVLDRDALAPYPYHPMCEVDLSAQIPRRGDQRQMEPWQRYGVYAAGMALENAGVKDNADLLATMDMVVAAGGGERDISVDEAVMTKLAEGASLGDRAILEQLNGDLRPTLFLAQLPNLLAGNISIVHGVTGTSRTFMGEEACGADAARIGHARIAAGQSEICLVGGSFNAARPDMLLVLAFAEAALRGEWKPVWEREANPGAVFGSMGAFLVMESPEHAKARGARPLAKLTGIEADRCARKPGEAGEIAHRQWQALSPSTEGKPLAILSGASGAGAATAEERAFLTSICDVRPDTAVRATGTMLGHGMEPQFLLNLALAALTVSDGNIFPPRDATGLEKPLSGEVRHAIVTGWGHWRGEAMALVEAV
ncbi:MAG: beta-ketoacyl-ACP synthase [Rhodobiaceae bacterium]|nr:beta-ketoacyl-ACP synthase [Rhodobiaceae bacterium]MCC0057209.1 beta-ketoacyl-ACP synthase [Rhodobiaceae bacterium]